VTSVKHDLPRRKVTVGVDTHKHLHAAVTLDELGARLGELIVPADTGGYSNSNAGPAGSGW
jgi:transposase